jgi:hypothetical protein
MTKIESNTEEERFSDLSNLELVYIYYRLKKYVEVLDKNLDKNVTTKTIDTPMGVATAMKPISEKHVKIFKETVYYKTAHSVIEKLKPTIKVIEECDNEVIKVLDQFKK